MIYLKKGQKLFNNEGMVVCGSTGYYEDGATVLCAMAVSPEEPVYSYEAKYIAYGDQVYNISDEDLLMEEIKKIDPESLFGKTNIDFTTDNLIQEIKTVENPTPELTQDLVDENNANINDANSKNEDISQETISDNLEKVEDSPEIDSNVSDSGTENIADVVDKEPASNDIENVEVDIDNNQTTTEPIDVVIPEVINTDEVVNDNPISILYNKRNKKIT